MTESLLFLILLPVNFSKTLATARRLELPSADTVEILAEAPGKAAHRASAGHSLGCHKLETAGTQSLGTDASNHQPELEMQVRLLP